MHKTAYKNKKNKRAIVRKARVWVANSIAREEFFPRVNMFAKYVGIRKKDAYHLLANICESFTEVVCYANGERIRYWKE